MTIRLAFAALIACCGLAHAAAPTDAKTKLALELMDVTHADRTIRTMIDQMPAMMEQNLKLTSSCDAAQPIMADFAKEMTAKMSGALLSDDMKIDTAAVYAEVFSEDELHDIIAFYKSPIGAKMLDRMPELMQKSMQLAQRRMATVMPQITQIGESYGPRLAAACQDSKASALTPKH